MSRKKVYYFILSTDYSYCVPARDLKSADPANVKLDDEVAFKYGSLSLTGTVKFISESESAVLFEIKKEKRRGRASREGSFHADAPRKSALKQRVLMKQLKTKSNKESVDGSAAKASKKLQKKVKDAKKANAQLLTELDMVPPVPADTSTQMKMKNTSDSESADNAEHRNQSGGNEESDSSSSVEAGLKVNRARLAKDIKSLKALEDSDSDSTPAPPNIDVSEVSGKVGTGASEKSASCVESGDFETSQKGSSGESSLPKDVGDGSSLHVDVSKVGSPSASKERDERSLIQNDASPHGKESSPASEDRSCNGKVSSQLNSDDSFNGKESNPSKKGSGDENGSQLSGVSSDEGSSKKNSRRRSSSSSSASSSSSSTSSSSSESSDEKLKRKRRRHKKKSKKSKKEGQRKHKKKQQKRKRSRRVKNSDSSSDDSGDEDSKERSYKKIRRNLELYNGQMFNYSEESPGVVRVHPDHAVFIPSKALEDAVKESRSVPLLIKTLVKAVFTKDALKGSTAQGYPNRVIGSRKLRQKDVLPRLDPEGREAIMKKAKEVEDAKKAWRPRIGHTAMTQAFTQAVKRSFE